MMTKKLQKRVRWSPRRVGTRVMYSRIARKEMTPKRMSDPMRPTRMEAAKMAHIFHQARMRALRLSIVVRLTPGFWRLRRTLPTTLEMARRQSTPPNSQTSLGSRKASSIRRSNPAKAADGFARALEEEILVFVRRHLNGLAKGEQAEHGHREELTLWQDAIEIFEVGGNEFDIGATQRHMIQAGTKRSDLLTATPCALREKDERVFFAERRGHIFNQMAADKMCFLGIFGPGQRAALQQDRAKHIFREVTAKRGLMPIILGGDGPRARANFRGKSGP